MGLFDDMPSFEELANTKKGKYLTQGVHLLEFSHAEYKEASGSGNKGVAFHFLTGATDKEGNPETKNKTFWLMDKAMKNLTISEKSLKAFAETLAKVLKLDFRKISTISELDQVAKLKGLPIKINEAVEKGIKATVTYDYNNQPSQKNGIYYLEIQFVNDADSYEYWKNKTTFGPNPNPPRNSGTTDATESNFPSDGGTPLGSENEPDDLPF